MGHHDGDGGCARVELKLVQHGASRLHLSMRDGQDITEQIGGEVRGVTGSQHDKDRADSHA